MTPIAPDRSLRDPVEAGQYASVRDTTIALFVRANAGEDIIAGIPGLLGLLGSHYARLALPALSLVALQQRDRIVASVQAMGLKPAWHLREGSVMLPDAQFGWESADAERASGYSNTFRVEVANAFLQWFERNLLLRQPIEEFLRKGPPPRHAAPGDVVVKLRAIVGGPAGENRMRARERYLARVAEPTPGCGTCESLAKPVSADLREHGSLPAAAYALITVAVKFGEELRRCHDCGAHFHFRNEYEFQYEDTDHLRPASVSEAIAFVNDAFVVA